MKDRIRQVREEAGLSQRAFGQRIGVSGPSIARLESGENNPSEQSVRAICSEFGIRREWLENGSLPQYSEDLSDGPEALIPDLVGILSSYPAVLDVMQRVVRHMKPSDWERLNQLLDEASTKKDPEA